MMWSPGFFASAPPLLGGLIWREILCLLCGFWIGFGFLASVAVVGMTFFREERERGVVGVVTFEIWVLFFWVSLSEGKKMCVCGCFFLSFLDLELCSWFFFYYYFFIYLWVCVLGFEFVFLLFLFKTHLHLNSYDF